MWTISYNGFWLHGYTDRDEVRVQGSDLATCRSCRSLRAAKRWVRRQLR